MATAIFLVHSSLVRICVLFISFARFIFSYEVRHTHVTAPIVIIVFPGTGQPVSQEPLDCRFHVFSFYKLLSQTRIFLLTEIL